MSAKGTLLLKRSDIKSLLNMSDYITVVETAFRLHAEGKTLAPGLLHIDAEEGEFHIKAGGLHLDTCYFGLKANAGFFRNQITYGLPNIQGLILLYDGEKGSPLAVCDSMEITMKRTGAATAVAAKYLARSDSKIATICGCGIQGRIQLTALKEVLPLEKVFAVDTDGSVAEEFSAEMSYRLKIKVAPGMLAESAPRSDVCVTCTPSRTAFLSNVYLPQGTFVAAVGADSPDKRELEPEVVSENKVVADILDQCITVGEVHHAIEAGKMTSKEVYAELGEIISGVKPGRTSDTEKIVFDSTGTALQDTAAAAAVYEKAVAKSVGTPFEFTV